MIMYFHCSLYLLYQMDATSLKYLLHLCIIYRITFHKYDWFFTSKDGSFSRGIEKNVARNTSHPESISLMPAKYLPRIRPSFMEDLHSGYWR